MMDRGSTKSITNHHYAIMERTPIQHSPKQGTIKERSTLQHCPDYILVDKSYIIYWPEETWSNANFSLLLHNNNDSGSHSDVSVVGGLMSRKHTLHKGHEIKQFREIPSRPDEEGNPNVDFPARRKHVLLVTRLGENWNEREHWAVRGKVNECI